MNSDSAVGCSSLGSVTSVEASSIIVDNSVTNSSVVVVVVDTILVDSVGLWKLK